MQSYRFSNRGRLLGIERYSIIFQYDLNNNQISTTVFNVVLVTVSVLESRCTYFCIPCLESSEQNLYQMKICFSDSVSSDVSHLMTSIKGKVKMENKSSTLVQTRRRSSSDRLLRYKRSTFIMKSKTK